MAAVRAHGAKIDRSVSPAAGMVDGGRGGAADFAPALRSLPDLFEAAGRGDGLPEGIASAEDVPELLTEGDLALFLGDFASREGGAELADEGGLLLAGIGAIGAASGAGGGVAVGAEIGLGGGWSGEGKGSGDLQGPGKGGAGLLRHVRQGTGLRKRRQVVRETVQKFLVGFHFGFGTLPERFSAIFRVELGRPGDFMIYYLSVK